MICFLYIEMRFHIDGYNDLGIHFQYMNFYGERGVLVYEFVGS